MVRCVYREAGTGLAGGEENNKETTTLPDVNKMQELVHRYEKFCSFFAMVVFAAASYVCKLLNHKKKKLCFVPLNILDVLEKIFYTCCFVNFYLI